MPSYTPPPDINPHEYAVRTSAATGIMQVNYQGRHLVYWVWGNGADPNVWECESEDRASEWFALQEVLFAEAHWPLTTGDRSPTVYALDPDTGEAAWRIEMYLPVTAGVHQQLVERKLGPMSDPRPRPRNLPDAAEWIPQETYVAGRLHVYDSEEDAYRGWCEVLRRHADEIDAQPDKPFAELAAAHLRYKADRMQVELSGALLGNAIRRFDRDRIDDIDHDPYGGNLFYEGGALLDRVFAKQKWVLPEPVDYAQGGACGV